MFRLGTMASWIAAVARFGLCLPLVVVGQAPTEASNALLSELRSAQFPPQPPQVEAPADLACLAGPRGPNWGSAKMGFRNIFSAQLPPWKLAKREVLTTAMDGVMRDLKAVNAFSPQAADECGLGKLCLQLLSFATVEDPLALIQLFINYEQLSSPVLTMLLDVPWVILAQTGWPIFGLLAQINLRKGELQGALNDDAVDGLLEPESKAYQAYLSAALEVSDGATIVAASNAYLDTRAKASLGQLTAIAAQVLALQTVSEKAQQLQILQDGFKQVIQTAAELDIALSTQWPLWAIVHLAVDSLVA